MANTYPFPSIQSDPAIYITSFEIIGLAINLFASFILHNSFPVFLSNANSIPSSVVKYTPSLVNAAGLIIL